MGLHVANGKAVILQQRDGTALGYESAGIGKGEVQTCFTRAARRIFNAGMTGK